MGIDKSNVRWVIHYNLPKNIEGYYQEIGRCRPRWLAIRNHIFESYGDDVKNSPTGLNAEVQLAKLERMKSWHLELPKNIAVYFGELVTENCGNKHCKIHQLFC
jgi:ATP-dependent DNA helicase RecQ